MKWYEILAVLIGFGALTQFLKWILDSIKINESVGEPLTFFISSIFSVLIIIVLILTQQNQELKRMRDFLKTKGFREEEGFIKNMWKSKKNKRGVIDPRILWFIIGLIILYLLWKSGFFG